MTTILADTWPQHNIVDTRDWDNDITRFITSGRRPEERWQSTCHCCRYGWVWPQLLGHYSQGWDCDKNKIIQNEFTGFLSIHQSQHLFISSRVLLQWSVSGCAVAMFSFYSVSGYYGWVTTLQASAGLCSQFNIQIKMPVFHDGTFCQENIKAVGEEKKCVNCLINGWLHQLIPSLNVYIKTSDCLHCSQ